MKDLETAWADLKAALKKDIEPYLDRICQWLEWPKQRLNKWSTR